MKIPLAGVGACLLLFTLGLVAAPPPEVELLAEGAELTPSATLEFRFAREMVKDDALGLPVTPAPMVVQPALVGNFVWLSRRSGVFTPTQEPAMGVTYTVKLAPDLKDLAGKPIGASFKATLRTPAFGVTSSPTNNSDDPRAEPLPNSTITFNREVKLESAEKLIHYIDDKGRKVAAKVVYGTDTPRFLAKADHQPWEIRWAQAGRPSPTPVREEGEEEEQVTNRASFQITPVEILTPGGVWRLEVAPGLQALTGAYKTAEPTSIMLGRVEPFGVEKVTASSYLNSRRSAEITFTLDFDGRMREDSAAKFFTVAPAVKGLRFEVGYNSVTLRGEFARDVDYRVEISPEMRDRSGRPLSGERVQTVRFGYVKPRVYFPNLESHQMRRGTRQAVVTSVNMRSVRVRALLVPPEKAAAAFVAFEQYRRGESQDDNERYQPVSLASFPGTTIYDRTLDLSAAPADQAQETLLNWTEILKGIDAAGMVLLTADAQPIDPKEKRAGAQTLVQVTDLGVLWKKVGDTVQANVFSMATGQAVPEATVSFTRRVGEEKQAKLVAGASATTKADGSAQLALPENLAFLTVRKGGDAHTMRLGQEGTELPMAAFRLPISYDYWEPSGRKPAPVRAFLFSDRPLYLPGETAHVKGFVRGLGGKGLTFAAGRKGKVTLRHPRAGEDTFDITTDAHGAFDVDLPLAKGEVGSYSATLVFVGAADEEAESVSVSFLAADYQPNAFEAKIDLPARLAPGAAVSAKASGQYFFGALLAEARLQWTLQERTSPFYPEEFSEWNFGAESEENAKPVTLRGKGTIPAGGSLPIEPRLAAATGQPRAGWLTVEITDQNQQTVTERRAYTRDSASFYLGMQFTEGFTIGHAETMGALALALRPDGTPLPEAVPVKAELFRVIYETVREQTAGPAMSYRTERREELVETKQGRSLVPVRAAAEWAFPPGETARFQPGRGGQYLVRFSAPDGPRTVTCEREFVVSGSEAVAWDYHHPSQVDLVADKGIYHPGEKARLLVKTPIAGEAVITIERDNRILRTLRQPLEGNTPTLEIPLQAGDGPNVFVSMILIRGAEQSKRKVKAPEFRYGVCRLVVTEPDSALTVRVAPRMPKVEPGQEITAEIAVSGSKGEPVAGADVTFAALDDGVLALTGYTRPEPRPTFEKAFPLRIRTGLSLFDITPDIALAEAAPLAAGELFNKGYLIGGGGGDSRIKLRSDFPGTAAWLPKLITGADGKVLARFKAPDALTSYRLVAVAHAGPSRFASAESKVQIAKKLILLSGQGQFAHIGDELTARAVVRNESAAPGTARVALELDATAEKPVQPLTVDVKLKPGESKSVDFPVKLRARGEAQWKWTAQMETDGPPLQDGLLVKLNVLSPAPILHETYLPELKGARTNLLTGVNPQVLEGMGQVEVRVANTRLASLREASRALLEYPYGCAEQTISSLIPWLLSGKFDVILPDLASAEQKQAAIDEGLRRLEKMKVEGSGLAYWPGGQRACPCVSGYGLLALRLIAEQTGETPAMFDEVAKFVKESLAGMGSRSARMTSDDYALALYALASADMPEPEYEKLLFGMRQELTLEARALLACAMLAHKGSTGMIEKLLDERAAAADDSAWFGSPVRALATRLLAWVRFRPKDKEVTRLTQELLAAQHNGAWRTTQENAWALLALSSYFAAVEGKVQPVSGAVEGHGEPALFALTTQKLWQGKTFAFDRTKPLAALSVANKEKKSLYGDIRFTVEPPVALQPRQDRGYGVSRAYYKIGSDGKAQPAENLVVGDRVMVVLRLESTAPGHYLALDDPLPSILEAINPDFQAQGVDVGTPVAADYREIRADRVLYFCDHLAPGTYTFTYLARVRSAGKVFAPSTKVEEMYRPERFGLAAGQMLESKAR